jgi:hypothetical protein
MTWYELYLYLLLALKILELYFWVWHLIDPNEAYTKALFYANRSFMFSLCILMLYLFHPYSFNPVRVDRETKLFLFAFAILTLLNLFPGSNPF